MKATKKRSAQKRLDEVMGILRDVNIAMISQRMAVEHLNAMDRHVREQMGRLSEWYSSTAKETAESGKEK